MTKTKTIISVSQLNKKSKILLENSLGSLWVEGEVSNLAKPSSGHLYFSLKDSRSQIRCAFFRTSHSLNTPNISNGQQIIVQAKVSLYEPRGDYQLIINHIELAGFGQLQAQFEALKKKLATQGLFDAQRKKALPKHPQTIGVIASLHSAALQDVLTTLSRRFPAIPIMVFGSDVQGRSAHQQLINAIQYADKKALCDVLILTRGGGSIEDLWAFNNEQLAHCMAACNTPIVTGIGHEIDFTIADFVADARAPTPTAAAEAVTIDQHDLMEQLSIYQRRLNISIKSTLKTHGNKVMHLSTQLMRPSARIFQAHQTIDYLNQRMLTCLRHQQMAKQQHLNIIYTKLQGQHPKTKLQHHKATIDKLSSRLSRAIDMVLNQTKGLFNQQVSKLNAFSPLLTLERGYSITLKNDKVISSIKSVKTNEVINVRLSDGQIKCLIKDIKDSSC